MSEARFYRQLRTDWLESCADLLDVVTRGGRYRAAGDCSPGDARRAGAGADLLFDLVKLQAAQVNQLARLGLSHVEHSRRVFDAWYGGYGACEPASSPSHDAVVLRGKIGEEVSCKFLVYNRSAEKVTLAFDLACLHNPSSGEEFNHEPKFEPKERELAPHTNDVVTIHMKLNHEKLLKDRTFTSRIKIMDRDCVVDARALYIEVL